MIAKITISHFAVKHIPESSIKRIIEEVFGRDEDSASYSLDNYRHELNFFIEDPEDINAYMYDEIVQELRKHTITGADIRTKYINK